MVRRLACGTPSSCSFGRKISAQGLRAGSDWTCAPRHAATPACLAPRATRPSPPGRSCCVKNCRQSCQMRMYPQTPREPTSAYICTDADASSSTRCPASITREQGRKKRNGRLFALWGSGGHQTHAMAAETATLCMSAENDSNTAEHVAHKIRNGTV